jgi:hypothetical protein
MKHIKLFESFIFEGITENLALLEIEWPENPTSFFINYITNPTSQQMADAFGDYQKAFSGDEFENPKLLDIEDEIFGKPRKNPGKSYIAIDKSITPEDIEQMLAQYRNSETNILFYVS